MVCSFCNHFHTPTQQATEVFWIQSSFLNCVDSYINRRNNAAIKHLNFAQKLTFHFSWGVPVQLCGLGAPWLCFRAGCHGTSVGFGTSLQPALACLAQRPSNVLAVDGPESLAGSVATHCSSARGSAGSSRASCSTEPGVQPGLRLCWHGPLGENVF